MKTKVQIYSVMAAISVISLLTAVFPVLQDRPAPAPTTTIKFSQEQITVTTAATAPNVTVTTTIACAGGTDTQSRFDYLLNSGCDQIAIAAIPNLPHLSVTTAKSANQIFVQELPAPPQVRFAHNGEPETIAQINITGASFKASIFTTSTRYFVQSTNYAGRSPETKTLAELQVQRC